MIVQIQWGVRKIKKEVYFKQKSIGANEHMMAKLAVSTISAHGQTSLKFPPVIR